MTAVMVRVKKKKSDNLVTIALFQSLDSTYLSFFQQVLSAAVIESSQLVTTGCSILHNVQFIILFTATATKYIFWLRT